MSYLKPLGRCSVHFVTWGIVLCLLALPAALFAQDELIIIRHIQRVLRRSLETISRSGTRNKPVEQSKPTGEMLGAPLPTIDSSHRSF